MKKAELAYLTTMVINQQFELEEKAIKHTLESLGIEPTKENLNNVKKQIKDDNYSEFVFSYEGVDIGMINHKINDKQELEMTLTPL